MAQLPEELIAQTLAYLSQPISPAGLHALGSASSASRTFNRIAEPVLYRDIDLQWAFHSRPRSRRNFSAILLSLLSRPKRLRYVRELTMLKNQLEPPRHQSEIELVPPALVNHMLTAIGKLPLSVELSQDLNRGIKASSEDAKVAVFLAVCTNLRYWSLQCVEHDEGELNESLIMRLLRELRTSAILPAEMMPLQRLEHLVVERGFGLEGLELLLEVPSLQILDAGMANCVAMYEHWRCPARMVDLMIEYLEVDDIAKLFDVFPSMTSLALQGYRDVTEPADDCKAIGDVLRTRAARLTSLHLNIRQSDSDMSHLGSLADLKALRSLKISFPIIVGRSQTADPSLSLDETLSESRLARILPHSLEELTLFECKQDLLEILDAQLMDLLGNPLFASLRQITMMRSTPFVRETKHLGWCSAGEEFSKEDFVSVLSKSPAAQMAGFIR